MLVVQYTFSLISKLAVTAVFVMLPVSPIFYEKVH